MKWTRIHPPVKCSRCRKIIKPGKLLGCQGGQCYCYRCGTNKELAWAHRVERELDTMAAAVCGRLARGLDKSRKLC